MVRQKEGLFKAKILREIRLANGEARNLPGLRSEKRSWPDSIIAHPYWYGLLEFKGKTTRLQKHQKAKIKRLKECGFSVYVIREPDKIEDEEGNLLAVFPETGPSLMRKLRELENNNNE